MIDFFDCYYYFHSSLSVCYYYFHFHSITLSLFFFWFGRQKRHQILWFSLNVVVPLILSPPRIEKLFIRAHFHVYAWSGASIAIWNAHFKDNHEFMSGSFSYLYNILLDTVPFRSHRALVSIIFIKFLVASFCKRINTRISYYPPTHTNTTHGENLATVSTTKPKQWGAVPT